MSGRLGALQWCVVSPIHISATARARTDAMKVSVRNPFRAPITIAVPSTSATTPTGGPNPYRDAGDAGSHGRREPDMRPGTQATCIWERTDWIIGRAPESMRGQTPPSAPQPTLGRGLEWGLQS